MPVSTLTQTLAGDKTTEQLKERVASLKLSVNGNGNGHPHDLKKGQTTIVKEVDSSSGSETEEEEVKVVDPFNYVVRSLLSTSY